MATIIVVGEDVASLPGTHSIAAKHFVVHVEVRFEKEDSTKFFCSIVVDAFEKLDVDTSLPSPIGESGGVSNRLHGGVKVSKSAASDIGFEHAEVDAR